MTTHTTLHSRILIVDDSPIILSIHKGFLVDAYAIDTAENGRTALEKINTQHYVTILLDIELPDISGIELAKTIREKGGQFALLPIIGLSSKKEAHAEAIAAGMNELLIKPTNKKTLRDCITHWVNKLNQ